MGQANKRGTFEQRLALAIQKNEIIKKIVDKNLPEKGVREHKRNMAYRRAMNSPHLVTGVLAMLGAGIPIERK